MSTASQLACSKSKTATSRNKAVGTGVGVNRHVSGSAPSSRPATRRPRQTLGFVPAIRQSCGSAYGAQFSGTVILTKPDWALAVISWPSLPGMEHLVAVGSHSGLVENHTTGFSWGGTWAVLGLMCPELTICVSIRPVVKWWMFSGGSGPAGVVEGGMGIRWTWICMGWVRTGGMECGGKASRWEKSAAGEEPEELVSKTG